MTDDITKRRKRSAHLHVTTGVMPTAEQLNNLSAWLRDNEDAPVPSNAVKHSPAPAAFVEVEPPKKKPKPKRKSTPLHALSEGMASGMSSTTPDGQTHRPTAECADYHEQVPDVSKKLLGEPSSNPLAEAFRFLSAQKSARDMAAPAATCGSPSVNTFSEGRTSEGLSRAHGNQDASSGDHGRGTGVNDHVAFGHSSLDQSSTSVMPWMRRAEAQTAFVGQAGFDGGQFSSTDSPPGADRGRVSARHLDTSRAGRFQGMQNVNPNPGDGSRHYGTARNSATPPGGSHSLGNPTSHAVASKLETMKTTMRKLG